MEPRDLNETHLTEKFNIQTAGLILLSPYFKQLFNKLELLTDGEWKDLACQNKGVHLVRFLATGDRMNPEYNLVFEKVLCGMDISFPLPKEIELTDDDIAEAEELLHSVITNWPSLKNTSINGLREAFLKRDGILSKKEGNWLLQVERKTHDVLLERIPWGFSYLQLGWNKYHLITEW
jgi:hypothetical protein